MGDRRTAIGRYIPSDTAGFRPRPEVELAAYGGARLFSGKRVLDLGSGDGRLALGAARWARSVTGIDPDPTAVRGARANARRMRVRTARFVVGAAQQLPFAGASFDVVVLSWSL